MKFGFYLLGEKGYFVLESFIKEFGIGAIGFVLGARDSGVENDWFDDIADLCAKNNIVFYRREKVGTKSLPASDYQFAIGWKWLIKNSSSLIVCHDSLLPKYRGFSPLVNMLINGESEIGVTAIIATDKYDSGEIVYQASKRITYPKKISTAISEVIPLYSEVVIETAHDILSNGKLHTVPQAEDAATFSLWRDDKDYFINWHLDVSHIQRLVDAVGPPYHGASTLLNGIGIRVLDIEPVQDVVVENRSAQVGKVIFFDKNYPVVVCGIGLARINDVRSENGSSLIGQIKLRSRFEGNK